MKQAPFPEVLQPHPVSGTFNISSALLLPRHICKGFPTLCGHCPEFIKPFMGCSPIESAAPVSQNALLMKPHSTALMKRADTLLLSYEAVTDLSTLFVRIFGAADTRRSTSDTS